MAFEEVGIRAVVKNYGTFMSQIADINKSTEGLKTGLGRLQKAALIGGAALAGVSAAAMMFAKSSLGAAAQMETYVTQFKVLLGSADAAKERLAELAKFAAITPFELPEVVQASKLLQTFGGTALATGKTLTMVGDMAAASGAGYGEIATWVGRAYTAIQSGRPFGEAGMRLQELALMSGETRSKLEELQKTGASSTVIWDAFTASMGKYEGMMGELAVTFSGLTSTVADSYKGLLREFGTPLLEPAKAALTMIINFLSAPEVLAGAKALGEAIAGLGNQFLAFFSDKVTGAARSFGDALTGIAERLKGIDVASFFSSMTDPQGTLASLAGDLVDLGKAFGEIGLAMGGLGLAMGQVLAPILPQVVNALVPLVELIARSPQLVWLLTAAFVGMKLQPLITMFGFLASALTTQVVPALTATSSSAATATLKIGLLVGAVALAIPVMNSLKETLDNSQESSAGFAMGQADATAKMLKMQAAGASTDDIIRELTSSVEASRSKVEDQTQAFKDGAITVGGFSFNLGEMGKGAVNATAGMIGMGSSVTTAKEDIARLSGVVNGIISVLAGLEKESYRVSTAMFSVAVETRHIRELAGLAVPPLKQLNTQLGNSAGDGGGGAPAAGEAFRGLDQDLADLRQTMLGVAESGLAVLNAAILDEQAYLDGLTVDLAAATTEHVRLGDALKDVNKDLADAKSEMDDWKSAVLEGTRAFSDASQAIDEDSSKLGLAIAKVNLGILTEGLEEGDYASIGLSAKIRALADLIGFDLPHSGKLGFDKIQEVIDAAGGQMDIFSAKASVVNLQEKVKLGPEQYKLEKFFQDLGGYAEFSYEEIIAGASDAAREMAVLIIKQNDLNLSIERQAGLIDFLNKAQKDHEEILGRLQTAYDDLFGLTGKIDQSIKDIWEAQGGDQVIKSIEDAFAAMDRGQTDAATTAMNNATTLFDSIKAAIAVLYPGKENLLAPIETLLGEIETKVEIDVGDVGKLLSGDLSCISDDLGDVDKSVTGVQGEVTRGFVESFNTLKGWLITLLYGIAANTNWLSYLQDIRYNTQDTYDELRMQTGQLGSILDAINGLELSVTVNTAQKGAYVKSAGLASLHAGEFVWPNIHSMVEEIAKRMAMAGGGVAHSYPVSPHYFPSQSTGGNGGGMTIVSSPTFTTPTNEMMRQYERSFRNLAFSLRRP